MIRFTCLLLLLMPLCACGTVNSLFDDPADMSELGAGSNGDSHRHMPHDHGYGSYAGGADMPPVEHHHFGAGGQGVSFSGGPMGDATTVPIQPTTVIPDTEVSYGQGGTSPSIGGQ